MTIVIELFCRFFGDSGELESAEPARCPRSKSRYHALSSNRQRNSKTQMESQSKACCLRLSSGRLSSCPQRFVALWVAWHNLPIDLYLVLFLPHRQRSTLVNNLNSRPLVREARQIRIQVQA